VRSQAFTDRLAIARRLVAAGPSVSPLSPHVQDQFKAASSECKDKLHQAGFAAAVAEPHRGWRQRTRGDDPEARTLLLAAMLDCMAARCPHLRKGSSPQPAFALLPLRRIDCQRCVGVRRRPPAEDGDRCDVCGSRGVTFFTPFAVACGAVLISGDACPSCASTLQIGEAAA
jgi:hypothetical protein